MEAPRRGGRVDGADRADPAPALPDPVPADDLRHVEELDYVALLEAVVDAERARLLIIRADRSTPVSRAAIGRTRGPHSPSESGPSAERKRAPPPQAATSWSTSWRCAGSAARRRGGSRTRRRSCRRGRRHRLRAPWEVSGAGLPPRQGRTCAGPGLRHGEAPLGTRARPPRADASRAAGCRCRSRRGHGVDRSRRSRGKAASAASPRPSRASAVARWSNASTLSRSAASAASALSSASAGRAKSELDGGQVDQRRRPPWNDGRACARYRRSASAKSPACWRPSAAKKCALACSKRFVHQCGQAQPSAVL